MTKEEQINDYLKDMYLYGESAFKLFTINGEVRIKHIPRVEIYKDEEKYDQGRTD